MATTRKWRQEIKAVSNGHQQNSTQNRQMEFNKNPLAGQVWQAEPNVKFSLESLLTHPVVSLGSLGTQQDVCYVCIKVWCASVHPLRQAVTGVDFFQEATWSYQPELCPNNNLFSIHTDFVKRTRYFYCSRICISETLLRHFLISSRLELEKAML